MKKVLVSLIVVASLFFLSTPSAIAGCYPDNNNPPCEADLDFDCDVDADDVTMLLENFGREEYYLPCPSSGPTPVPKTGQTKSYASYDDGDLERGVALVSPRFTDNLDGTITDNQTGLIWLKDANCFGMRTWNNALSDSNGLENGECGLTDGSTAGDWWLPNKRELISLTHDGYFDPAVSNTAGTGQWSAGDPFNNVQSFGYWSSTTYADSTLLAWSVVMLNGFVDFRSKSYNYVFYVWPVRGGH